MMQMSVAHINVLTKCDKVRDKAKLEQLKLCHSCKDFLSENLPAQNQFSVKYSKLNSAITEVIDQFSVNGMSYFFMDIADEQSLPDLQMTIDNMVQFDEGRAPKDCYFQDEQDPMELNEGAEYQ